MSDKRLITKLVQAGYKEVDITTLDRPLLLNEYARTVLTETAYEPQEVELLGDEMESDAATAGTDSDTTVKEVGNTLEMRRLLLEEKKLEEQRLQREEQRLQRLLEERKYELEKKKVELKLKEKEHRNSPAVTIKNWSDAMRNTITKMPSESIETVRWFVSVEKLFDQLKVPADLQTVLIRPYLSDQAKQLISKCEFTHTKTFKDLKKYLLRELHLSPSVYLDKFNTLAYDKSETYNRYTSRLMSLFEYY